MTKSSEPRVNFQLLSLAIALTLLVTSSLRGQSVSVEFGDDPNFVILGDGFTTASNNGLNAEASNMWGITNNSSNRIGIYYSPYSSVVSGSSLPATIQAGTYTLSGRVGSNGIGGGGFAGLNNGNDALKGLIAGFFSTVADSGSSATQDRTDAQNTKNNMFTEFNNLGGVIYTAPSEADPNDDTFTTWTFEWNVQPGSSVIGSDPFFGAYVKTGSSGGNGFWDNSTLSYDPNVAFIPGDTDGDGVAENATFDPNGIVIALGDDLTPIVNNFYTSVGDRTDGDLNLDGFVDFSDFREWKDAVVLPLNANFSTVFTTIPEPSCMALFAISICATSLRRNSRRQNE